MYFLAVLIIAAAFKLLPEELADVVAFAVLEPLDTCGVVLRGRGVKLLEGDLSEVLSGDGVTDGAFS